jgi:hypothetical protein
MLARRPVRSPPGSVGSGEEVAMASRLDAVVVDAADPRAVARWWAETLGSVPARVLVLHAPAMDRYFRELQALWAGPTPPDRDAELGLMRRHGMTPA